jgi:hypothetical protein
MNNLETSTSERIPAPAPAEPGHLHFDRAGRRWLSHEPDGTLHPYAEHAHLDAPGGKHHHAVAA